MRTATQILRREHEGIMKMLEVAEAAAKKLERGKRVSSKTLRDLLDFFQTFADKCHHSKEEELLFPALETKGIPRAGGPIGIMLTDHEQGRALINALSQATSDYLANRRGASQRWARTAWNYIHLVRGHIYREDNVLLAIAEGILRPNEQDELAEKFEKLEIERVGRGTHTRLHGVLNRVTARKAA